MQDPPNTNTTFAERFCEANKLPRKHYSEAVLSRSLYPLARLLLPVLRLNRSYLEADREFIASVGRLTHTSNFTQEIVAYFQDPNNRGFLRKGLRLRVSGRRLNRLVADTMHERPEG